MQTKMNIYVTVKPRAKSRELYERLAPFKANVTDVGDTVYVYTQIDIREDAVEKILSICREYGECSVGASMVKEDAPSG